MVRAPETTSPQDLRAPLQQDADPVGGLARHQDEFPGGITPVHGAEAAEHPLPLVGPNPVEEGDAPENGFMVVHLAPPSLEKQHLYDTQYSLPAAKKQAVRRKRKPGGRGRGRVLPVIGFRCCFKVRAAWRGRRNPNRFGRRRRRCPAHFSAAPRPAGSPPAVPCRHSAGRPPRACGYTSGSGRPGRGCPPHPRQLPRRGPGAAGLQ